MKGLKFLLVGVVAIITAPVNGQWAEVEWAQTAYITALDFVDDHIGYARLQEIEGPSASFVKTMDGGQTWNEITLPVSSDVVLQNLDFYAEGQGVVVIQNSESGETITEIYHTSDDGANWTNISLEETDPGIGISQIIFLNQNVGFFISGYSYYATTDAGENWFTSQFEKSLMSIDFYDALNGVIGTWDGTFNYSGSMLATSDGGLTWIETELNLTQSTIGKVIQIDETTAYAAPAGWGSGGHHHYYKTIDSGQNWTIIEVPENPDNIGLESIDFRDELNGVVALTNEDGFQIYATVDGGENWTQQNDFPGGYLTTLTLTPNSGYLTVQNSELYRLNTPLSAREYNKASFNLYPNPVTSGQTLRWESPLGYSSATIFDVTGKVIHHVLINQSESLELPILNRGVYLVSFENENANQVVKIVVD